MKRRSLLQKLAFTPLLLSPDKLFGREKKSISVPRLQYSVNAYSFNSQLRSGAMTFYDMMEFAADIGLDAVDLTGYYFSNYPEAPPDTELFPLKQKALELGLNITWTGVRNDFVNPDPAAREADKELIRNWLIASSKLGASIMRVFAGAGNHEGYSREEVKNWMVEDFRACCQYAEKTGVVLGMQHHNNFLFQSDEIIDILERVDSKWFGLNLDTGSLHAEDPYLEIENLAPYARYWFIKEFVYPGGTKTSVDMKRIAGIIKENGYRGYVSFENLSPEDPKKTVAGLFETFRNEYEKV